MARKLRQAILSRYAYNLGGQHVELYAKINLLRDGQRFAFSYGYVQMRVCDFAGGVIEMVYGFLK